MPGKPPDKPGDGTARFVRILFFSQLVAMMEGFGPPPYGHQGGEETRLGARMANPENRHSNDAVSSVGCERLAFGC